MKYEFIDTHTHLYLKEFKDDIDAVVERAVTNGVKRMFLPNLDSSSIGAMLSICDNYTGTCFPMIGLHPSSVKENYKQELEIHKKYILNERFIAIGEIGIDLYWDKTFIKEQQAAFREQLQWAKITKLPVVIHARDSFDEIFEILDEENDENLNGVFHSFTGNAEHVKKILSYGFYIGINGIVTFKNSGLEHIVKNIPIESLLIETDSPFLAPVPYRGKRNESYYVIEVAEKISSIYSKTIESIATSTSRNALNLFKKAV